MKSRMETMNMYRSLYFELQFQLIETMKSCTYHSSHHDQGKVHPAPIYSVHLYFQYTSKNILDMYKSCLRILQCLCQKENVPWYFDRKLFLVDHHLPHLIQKNKQSHLVLYSKAKNIYLSKVYYYCFNLPLGRQSCGHKISECSFSRLSHCPSGHVLRSVLHVLQDWPDVLQLHLKVSHDRLD